MRRRYRFGHLILASVVVMVLTPLMVVVDAQAQIAFMSQRDGNPEIYVMDTDGGNLRRLTNHPGWDFSPSWSPDGKRIVFESDRDNDRDHNIDIYVMDADGGNQQKLTNHRAWDSSPSWSPDSQRIVFHSKRDGNYEIYVMDTDGGNLQNLTNHPGGDFGPAWLNTPFSVSPTDKQFTMWGRVK